MSRIRSIKPEFWDDADLAEDLTREQRLLYIGLWNLCFDNWTMEYDARQVKKALFGYDADVTPEIVDAWVCHIAETGRIQFFTFEGKTCLYLPKCHEHQRINRPSSSPIPAPDSGSTSGGLTDDSLSPQPSRARTGGELVVGAGSREQGEDARKRASLPACLSRPNVFPDFPAETLSGAILQAAEAQWGLGTGKPWSPADTATFCSIVADGCLPGCPGSKAQAEDCASLILATIAKPACDKPWRACMAFIRKVTTEDRRDLDLRRRA